MFVLTRPNVLHLLSLFLLAPACLEATESDLDTETAHHRPSACPPDEASACYSGPSETDSVGTCQRGVKTCDSTGTSYGACVGEVVPTDELCDGLDCDGVVDDDCQCTPGETSSCYDGPPDTEAVGTCARGTHVCNESGIGHGACVDVVRPVAEICGDGLDNDCNGDVDQGCVCPPGETWTCYSAPLETDGIGACQRGVKTCAADGLSYGACVGEIVPTAEICGNDVDEDCDGTVDVDCCEEPPPPAGCAGGTYNGKRYAICQGSLNVPESEAACAAQGMHLAFVDTPGENAWIVDTALAAFGYVGYFETSYWIANTKTRSSLLPWADFEPNNVNDDCIHVLRYVDQPYSWNDAHCLTWRWGRVCEGALTCDPSEG